ncbi:DUF6266 family protein [Bacteroidota bacterium]
MARIKDGINTPLSGKIGNLVTSHWKGIPYLKSKPGKIKQPNSEKQLAHRMKFSTVMKFITPFKDFFMFSFSPHAIGKTGYNVAVSENMKTAIQGEYPDISINYPGVVLSRGELAASAEAMIEREGEDKVRISWTSPEGTESKHDNDRAAIVLYNADDKKVIYFVDIAKRSEGGVIISLPADFLSKHLECYLIFITREALLGKLSVKNISDSCYAGGVE